MRIVLTGGATGGHLFPLVAVARKIKEKLGMETELLYIGSGVSMEKEVMDKEGIPAKYVFSGKMRRYFSLLNILDIFKIPIGIAQSLWILLKFMPDVVFSKGGYVSVPVVLVAWAYRIPILIHESDAMPGAANQILGKFSSRVAIAYPTAQTYFQASRTALLGNPVREGIASGNVETAREYFKLTQSRPTILVLGGSQGAKAINDAIIRILPKLLTRTQIIHQTGERNYQEATDLAAVQGVKEGREGYIPVKFLDENVLRDAYAVADLVISRAGANSITEIAACGKATILIPLGNSANNHQQMNAYEIARVGGALVLEEANLGENVLMAKIEKLLDDENLRKSMEEKIRSFYHPDAAENIANGVIELGKK